MKLLESIIQGEIYTSEQYAACVTAKSAAYAPRMKDANRPDDTAPVQHPQSNGRVSDMLREVTLAASELLPADAGELRESNMAPLDKTGAIVQRAVNDAAMGNAHNLAFALKMQSEARADAFSNIRLAIQGHRMTQVEAISPLHEQLMTKSALDPRHEMALSSSASGPKHGLGALASPPTQSDPSPAPDPDTSTPSWVPSTPADVDAIKINSLEDLKAYYAQYAADYKVLAAYVQENTETDPTGCEEKIQVFASKYSAPLIVNAGIDPAYASVALGGDWRIHEFNLPGKGTFEAYQLNLDTVQAYLDDQAFCNRLQDDRDAAACLWQASGGSDYSLSGTPPSYSEASAALEKVEASFNKNNHVSVLPDNLPEFYTISPDPAGGYFVYPSEKFKETINSFNDYLAAWRAYYGGGISEDNQTFNKTDEKYNPSALKDIDPAYGLVGKWLGQSIDNEAWLSKITQYMSTLFESWNPDVARANANLDSLERSDAAQYGGLYATIGAAKAAIVDNYGNLISEYMSYTQSATDLVADLSKYVKATDDGSKVTFNADDLRSEIQQKIDSLSQWSLTTPGTSLLSVNDWNKELSGNFIATKNADATTTLRLDLTNLIGMRDSLAEYSNADISVTQYNAWYSGFSSEKDNVQNLSQSIAEKYSRMNSAFDNLVRMMSSTISALLESEAKYFQW
ncbi:putative xsa-invasion protein [Xanthomonas phaseoli pv. phaseoli]|uniref:IpaD/SipD/SspD family type III secretion system needle tip protein n=1 Tax=Xanthomonas phaseoli TaxID=1985254 RepID=UPI000C3300FD|nr:IpaD/SipD/SspD family type III secretion system needle tip protein [Xanthomonas phaseoli]SOO29918.1 putative xsa-invasion protein [Xanthomonas phaseoli pv. phaseoli]